MKILLINPPISSISKDDLCMREPLCLAYLAGMLKAHKYDVFVVDFYSYNRNKIIKVGNKFRKGATDQEIVKQLAEFKADIIGITCNFTVYSEDALYVAKIAKERYPNSIIILGGAHASLISPQKMLENNCIDIIVKGEGEITLLEIVRRYEAKQSLDDIKGTLVRKGDRVIINAPRELLNDMDSLPFPSRELLDMEYYLNQSDIFGHAKGKRVAILITSRGCPYDCIFCSVKSMWERRWRPFSAERVVQEIKLLISRYEVDEIFIYDDNFIIDRNRVVEICNLIEENKLKIAITIPSGLHVNLIDQELLKSLKKAGLYRVVLPIETGCEKTAQFIRKKVNFKDVSEKIQLCHNLGLWTSGNFLIGFPYETKEDIEETIQFAERSTLDFVFYFIAQPYFGSDLLEIFKKEKLLLRGDVDITSKVTNTKYNTKFLIAKELQNIRDRAAARYPKLKIIQYIINPRLFFLKIGTLDAFMYFLKLLTNTKFILRIFGAKKI